MAVPNQKCVLCGSPHIQCSIFRDVGRGVAPIGSVGGQHVGCEKEV